MPSLKLSTILLVLFLVASSHAADQSDTKRAEEAVRQVLQAASDALVRQDAQTLEQIYTNDWIFINPSGSVLTKTQQLSGLASGELKYESIETDQLNIRIYQNTAVATLRSMIKGQNRGQDFSGAYRMTTVFVKNKKGWQIVSQQSTSILQRGK